MIDTIAAYTFTHNLGKLPKPRQNQIFTIKEINGVNIKVSKTADEGRYRVSFEESLHKLVEGNNLRRSSPLTTKRGLMIIKKAIKIPLSDFIVTRIDFGVNVIVNEPVPHILQYFETMKYFTKDKKYSNKGTLYFKTKNQHLILYDKKKEMVDNYNDSDPLIEKVDIWYKTLPKIQRTFIDSDFQKNNILRIEFSRKYDIKRLIGENNLEYFHSNSGYKKMAEILKLKYNHITKRNDSVFSKISSIKDLRSFLYKNGIESLGGLEVAIGMIKDLEVRKLIGKSASLNEIQKLKDANSNKGSTRENPLIEYINKSFYQEIEYNLKNL